VICGRYNHTHVHVNHCYLVRRDDMEDAICRARAGDQHMRQALELIGCWLADTHGRPPDQAPICLDCDTVFGRALRPDGFMVVTPFIGDGQAIVSGVPTAVSAPTCGRWRCSVCADIWPDALRGEVG
jgi:hypothetical protein